MNTATGEATILMPLSKLFAVTSKYLFDTKKVKNQEEATDYTPVSLTSILYKIFKRV